ncbi:restriction endonuclease subunit S [Blautia sp. AF19-34]|nr:restriction endonuclease subunit S [Blautia sp. AF19-34]
MEKCKLGDICEIVSGSTPKTNVEEYWDGDIKWITPAEINENVYVINDSVRKITKLAVEKTGLSSFPKGTVILSSRAPIGKVAIAGCEMYCNQGFKNLICSEKIYNKYLYWFLKGNTIFLNSLGRGATFKEISKSIVSKIEIYVPPIKEQYEVVKNLETVSRIIELRKQELCALDTLVKARFVEMFGNIKENRFVKCKMREVAHIKHGYAYSGEYFSDKDNGVVLVTPGNFALGGGFQEIKNKYFTSKYPEEYVLHPGDLIVTMTDLSKKADTLGYGAIIPDNTSKIYLHNQRIGLFDELDKRLNPVFVRWFMQTDEYRLEIVRTSTGSTVHHTSPDRILDSLIFLPPIQLQNDFVKFANQVDKSKVKVQKALDETQKLFDSLMQQYFG